MAKIKATHSVKNLGMTQKICSMGQSKAASIMQSLVTSYKNNGFEIFSVVYACGMYLTFNALSIRDGELIELHTYSVEL